MMNKFRFSLISFMSLLVTFFSSIIHAADCKNVPKWLEIKEVVFQVIDPTEKYNIKVEIPKISMLKCSASYLDYGTDYSFSLEPSEPVKLGYYKNGEEKVSRSTEMSNHLTTHSVILAADREKTPHYYEIIDEELEVAYYVYLSKEKGPSHVERKGKKQKLKILSYK